MENTWIRDKWNSDTSKHKDKQAWGLANIRLANIEISKNKPRSKD